MYSKALLDTKSNSFRFQKVKDKKRTAWYLESCRLSQYIQASVVAGKSSSKVGVALGDFNPIRFYSQKGVEI